MITLPGFRAAKHVWRLLAAIAMVACFHSSANASPDCSRAGPRPSAECAAKIDDCKKTSMVYVLAVLGRQSGLTENSNLSRLSSNSTHEIWYVKNRNFIKITIHTIYGDDTVYKKLRAGIAPNKAFALSNMIAGCSADTSVEVAAP